MKWFEKCLLELTHHNMFVSTDHRSRFLDLISCYFSAPFFTKGLAKCMYLSSWDDEHFIFMLSTLNDMILDGTRDVRDMGEQGLDLAKQCEGNDAEVFLLSAAFLLDTPYRTPDYTALDPEVAYKLRKAIVAGKYIDDLPDPRAEETDLSSGSYLFFSSISTPAI